MGCSSCKNSKSMPNLPKGGFGDSIYVKIIIFIFSLVIVLVALVPIIVPFIAYTLFNRIVLDDSLDVTKPLIKFGKLIKSLSNKKSDDEDDDEDDDEINPDDYELTDVEVLK